MRMPTPETLRSLYISTRRLSEDISQRIPSPDKCVHCVKRGSNPIWSANRNGSGLGAEQLKRKKYLGDSTQLAS